MPQNEQRFILLVDDEEIVVMAFIKAFEGQTDFLLDVAQTPSEAIIKIAKINYDLIWLDMKMEGNSYAGMNVLRELNKLKIMTRNRGQRTIDTRVVIMSASIPLSDVMWEANEMGVISFWAKPVSDLENAVRRALNMVGVPVTPKPPLTSEPERPQFPP